MQHRVVFAVVVACMVEYKIASLGTIQQRIFPLFIRVYLITPTDWQTRVMIDDTPYRVWGDIDHAERGACRK
jgi:hypothetical protein